MSKQVFLTLDLEMYKKKGIKCVLKLVILSRWIY